MSIDNTILEFKQQTTISGGGNNNHLLLKNLISSTNNTISSIQVNIKELNLKIYNEIIISWNILNNEETSISDWIGIYKTDALKTGDYLEMKILDSFNGSKIGHLTWQLNKLKSPIRIEGE